MDQRFVSQAFPRSSGYHSEWIMASVSGGANSLWLTEWLTEVLELQPGMRVLDLGCGRGASSIFLRRCLHSATWWRRHWEQGGIMDIEMADTMPDGWQKWLDWHRAIARARLKSAVALNHHALAGTITLISIIGAGIRVGRGRVM